MATETCTALPAMRDVDIKLGLSKMHKINNQRQCAFCDEHLSQGKSGTRAREHVFKKSWIEKLGHQNTKIHLDHFRKDKILRQSQRPAIHFFAGDICNACNRGWMNEVDNQAEKYIIGLAQGNLMLNDVDDQGKSSIARWMMKTAATFVFSDSKDRRHIPVTTLRNIREPNFLPKGFVVFAYQYQIEQRSLAAATSDTLIEIDRGVSMRFKKSERLKFGIQYDRLILGCSYVEFSDATFIGLPRMHQPLYTPGNNFFLDEDLWSTYQKCIINTPFHRDFLNDFLLGVTFWSESSTLS